MEKFKDLFILELSNNHLGDFDRAVEMILRCAQVVKKNNVKSAIKFQLRDTQNFVHKDYKNAQNLRYVRKVLDFSLSWEEYEKLFDLARENNLLCCATPFDEVSALKCKEFNLDFIKIASCDIKNIPLLKTIATLKMPTIVSLGGADDTECENIVQYLKLNDIDFAINYCASSYPSYDKDLNLDKITKLKERFSPVVVGFSTHQKNEDLIYSIPASTTLGAQMIERHVDIEFEGKMRMEYCSTPEQLEQIFIAYQKTKEIINKTPARQIIIEQKEKELLSKFTRALWAKKDLTAGEILSEDDFYFAIPYLNKNQLTHNDLICNLKIKNDIKRDEPITFDNTEPFNPTVF